MWIFNGVNTDGAIGEMVECLGGNVRPMRTDVNGTRPAANWSRTT